MKLDNVVMTKGVNYVVGKESDFALFIITSLQRYAHNDWGNLCDEDKKMNDLAVKNGNDRIVARYNHEKGDIYIITEWDRSVTTILFCDEY